MTFEEIDNYVNTILKSKYKSMERRDYREIEKNDPIMFKGYGEKSGLMYLVDYGDHYIDINILPDSTRMVFRKDSETIISLIKRNAMYNDSLKNYINSFMDLIDEYVYSTDILYKRISQFNRGNIPSDLKRNNKINDIIS